MGRVSVTRPVGRGTDHNLNWVVPRPGPFGVGYSPLCYESDGKVLESQARRPAAVVQVECTIVGARSRRARKLFMPF